MGSEGRRVISLAAQFQRALARGEMENVRSALQQLFDDMPTSQGKQLVTQLQAALPDEITARENTLAAQIAALLGKAARSCIDAKKESDLDPVSNEIDAMETTLASRPDIHEAQKMRAAREFLEQWQKYIAEDAAGYQMAALATLFSIRDNPPSYPLVPLSVLNARIDLLAQAEPSECARKILDGLTKLDDLPAALAALKAISLQNSPNSPAPPNIDQLTRLESGAAALKAGNYSAALGAISIAPMSGGSYDFDNSSYTNSTIPPVFFRLREQLLIALLPAYLALPENPQPKPGENPGQYLHRLADGAAAREGLRRSLANPERDENVRLQSLCSLWIDAGIAGCASVFPRPKTGTKPISFAAALSAYNRVLSQAPSRFNPVAQATARIVALRKDHPSDLEKIVTQPN